MEFLIIMPSTRINGGVRLAEKLRAKIESHMFESIHSQTASFGVAEYIEGDTLKSLIQRVDKSLYRANGSDRNRVGT